MLLLRKGWFFFSFVVIFDPSLGVSTDDGIYWGWHMEMVPLSLMLLRTLVWWIRWCPWTKQESFLTIKERSMYSRWIHLGTWWSKGASEQILLQSRCALSAIWTRKVIPWFHNSTLALYSTICRLLTCSIWLFVGCRNLNGTLFLFTCFPILRCTNLGSGLSLLVWMVLNGPVMVARCLGMVKAFWRMFQGLPMYCFFASIYSFFYLVLDICQYLESF